MANDSPNQAVRDFVRLAESMGPPPMAPVATPIGEQFSHARCACNKLVPVGSLRVFNTGVVNAVDNVCKGCVKTYSGLALLVCARCRVVIARVSPHKDKIGFRFDANRAYHTESCPVCDPSVKNGRTMIIEQLLYHRQAGRRM